MDIVDYCSNLFDFCMEYLKSQYDFLDWEIFRTGCGITFWAVLYFLTVKIKLNCFLLTKRSCIFMHIY
jgi:hypothetical protein